MRTKSWLTPVPPTVAVEIASRRVTVVELSRSRGHRPTVTRQASEALPSGALTPALTGLNIADPAEVAAAVERAFGQAGLAVPGRAALIVPDSVARVSLVTLEQVPARAADLDRVIRWQIKKATPFSIDDAQVSHFPVSSDNGSTTMATIVARRDVIAEYEAIALHLGIQPGIVDLAGLNVMNAVIGSGTAPDGDWLLVHLAGDATTLAILRGASLMFYRHRLTVDDEPLGSLVHQTAMYHEDRLGGGGFDRAWIAGGGPDVEAAREQISARLGIPVDPVDVRESADFGRSADILPESLDSLAAPVGMLMRDHAA